MPAASHPVQHHFWAIFAVFLRLGLTSFGGPIAHLGYFRQEFVYKRQWLSEQAYAELLALCQFLPGPASSQVGIAIGLQRGGVAGALAAWLGFTLPSALALFCFALYLHDLSNSLGSNWLHGLKVLAVAVVAQAILGMGKTLCPDIPRKTLAFVVCLILLWLPGAGWQLLAIGLGALAGKFILTLPPLKNDSTPLQAVISKPLAGLLLLTFFLLLLLLPVLANLFHQPALWLFDSFYRSGALVFGGGHVVLPLLEAELVPDMVAQDTFLAGYGAAQAVPGPLFTFSAFLGAFAVPGHSPWLGALIALSAIFLPAFILVLGVLPFWSELRKRHGVRQALSGVNAAVVGVLLAAFIQPVLSSAILSMQDLLLALLSFALLQFTRIPPYLLVLLCAVAAGLGWH
ncbi:chromate efflux transporter [Bowmanella denitrificans]|uniref:chromate efflux transporter n=1 Tax=Bowmanella denitrificans TaxID=366582 RepID=UPI000C9BF703|nr:chromate efflux transporter [Bowmanella denitrificans]